MTHKQAANKLNKWVAKKVEEHLVHHYNEKEHHLEFNLASIASILNAFEKVDAEAAKILKDQAVKDGIISSADSVTVA